MLTRLAVLALVIAQLARMAPEPTEADREWVEKNIGAALDKLMPMSAPSMVAAYRVSADQWTDMAEDYFLVERVPRDRSPLRSESYVATVVWPGSKPLQGTLSSSSFRQQLNQLRAADTEASLDVLLLRVSVRRTRLTAEQCPAITSRTNVLRSLSMSPLPGPRNFMPLHAPTYQVVVASEGSHIRAVFDDASSGLARWAVDTFEALKKCGAP